MTAVRIRRYRPADLDALYRICLQTADNGQDATPMFGDPTLPGQIYAAPYALFEPSLAFVAEDDAGPGGYAVGALDTEAFERRLERDWWPRLRDRYPPPPDLAGQPWTADQRIAYQIHHPWQDAPEIARRYPSHLHINLVPRLQGRGHGGALMRALLGAMRAAGSSGVHLYVHQENERAIGFYRHLGFDRYPLPDTNAYRMDLRDAP